MTDSPPWLHSRFLYDAEGSRLFEAICDQPEYYLTRTERGILAAYADDIASVTGDVTMIELGSGFSVKTDFLLTAYVDRYKHVRYMPIDVSPAALEGAKQAIGNKHPQVSVTGIAGTYESAFPLFGHFSPSMAVFLGSTIGNFNQQEADVFWQEAASALAPGDFFLLGVDLVKDVATLNAAYNDAAGITARFTKNVFQRINTELGASIDLSKLEHVATYNEDWQRIEISGRFLSDQEIYVQPLDLRIPFPADSMVMTEISRKFTLEQLRENLQLHGFSIRREYTDPQGWFGVLLMQRDT